MRDANFIALEGRLTRDPELKDKNGLSIVTFAIANNRDYKERKHVNFFNCVVFGALGEKVVHKYAKKGDLVRIFGELTMNKTDEKIYYSVRVDDFRLLSSSNEKNPFGDDPAF
jgi:single stranded DNA-binding protein